MKKFLLILFIIFFGEIIFASPSFAIDYVACLNFHGTFTAPGWPDPNNALHIWCAGSPVGTPGNTCNGIASGDDKYIHPGETYNFGNCDCNVQPCLQYDPNTLPSGCEMTQPAACGENGNSPGDASFTVTCIPPVTTIVTTPTPSPVPPTSTPTPVCNCNTYINTTCTTSNGQPGQQSCWGISSNGTCGYSAACSTNCGLCVPPNVVPPTATPTPPVTLPPGVTNTPPVTQPPFITTPPTLPPGVTATVPPGIITPSPAPATCTCDGLTATTTVSGVQTNGVFAGQQATFTAFGIITGPNPSSKRISSISFGVLSGTDPANLTKIYDSGARGVIGAGTNRYASSFDYTVPGNIPSGTFVTVFATIACVNTTANSNAVQLASQTSQPQSANIFQRAIDFILSLFGKQAAPIQTFSTTSTQSVAPQNNLQIQRRRVADTSNQPDKTSCRFNFHFVN